MPDLAQKTAALVREVLDAMPRRERLLITIDGPCGSGKSTLAAALCEALQAPCVHMDDFYIPHAQKTPERLAIPGGNADVERLCADFLMPWLTSGSAVFQPYDCFADCLGAQQAIVDSPCVVLEGSYCNLPAIARHAGLRVWLGISREEQLRRLAQRNPERMQVFLSRWIPLEEAYHSAYSLPDPGCLVLSGA